MKIYEAQIGIAGYVLRLKWKGHGYVGIRDETYAIDSERSLDVAEDIVEAYTGERDAVAAVQLARLLEQVAE